MVEEHGPRTGKWQVTITYSGNPKFYPLKSKGSEVVRPGIISRPKKLKEPGLPRAKVRQVFAMPDISVMILVSLPCNST